MVGIKKKPAAFPEKQDTSEYTSFTNIMDTKMIVADVFTVSWRYAIRTEATHIYPG